MLILPAIDLLDGKVVRLRQGRRDQATVYSDRPEEVARAWLAAGAKRLHVVDLDGAFDGQSSPANRQAIETLIASGAELQVGGGVRTAERFEHYLDLGVAAVVLGTAAVENPQLVSEISRRHPHRVVVAVDAVEGKVAVRGWTEVATAEAAEVAERACQAGASAILYTDIARDGMATGPNVVASLTLQRAIAPVPLIASGGIGELAHLTALAQAGIAQAIVGRALYERSFTLSQALSAVAATTHGAPQ
jgi:phosphoribosylformimino-5-aminoimidazole carboxamide ribotide isomerase